MDSLQPPDSPGVGRCLRCASSIEESEQVGGICYDCQPAEAGRQPAFPVVASEYGGHGTCFGLTIRDYFAAHAPSIPCAWFQPVMSSAKPEFSGVRNASGDFDSTNESDIKAWELEYYKQQYIQWPYAWADLMLAARVKP